MEASRRLEGIGEYYFSQKLREIEQLNKQGKNVINLGIGSPDLPPHPDVIQVLHDEAVKPNVHAYQNYKGTAALRQAISNWYSKWYSVTLDPEAEILPLIGSKEGIMHICMAFINTGDKVLVPNPGYPTYRSAVKLAGGIPVDYFLQEQNDWAPDFPALEALVNEHGIRMMFLNYPHMPTGQLPTEELFGSFIEFAQKNQVLLCHDNPYSFILNDHPMSLLSLPGAKDVAIELNSLSKSHNMAGWRVGMLSGSKENIDQVLRFKSNMDSGMFLPLQLAAAKALELGLDWHQGLNETYSARRGKAFELLDLIDCQYSTRQAGMFVWARISGGYNDSYELSDAILNSSNVFITPGGIFGTAGDQYIRISLCSPEQKIAEAINRIKESGSRMHTNNEVKQGAI